jgi:hypothetical protein
MSLLRVSDSEESLGPLINAQVPGEPNHDLAYLKACSLTFLPINLNFRPGFEGFFIC